jgi:prepilin-type N-terminal cleavage/methylation domain-containing protein
MKNILRKNNSGFTLVEILFTISIFVVVFSTLTLFAKNIWTYSAFISGGLENVDASRNALKTMTTEIRTASQAENGSYLVSQATSSSFSFYSDINMDGLKEKVRYFLDNGSIKKGVIKPTGTPYSYNSTETITTMASYITSSSIFYYYDENYDGTTAPLSFPINIPNIRLVKIVVTMDKDINRSPAPATMTTQVSIRNLKDNL